jgi:hypothetical protein
MCYMQLKGKCYKENKVQYKRTGTGALDGIRKFTDLTKISITIADEGRKNQHQLAAQHFYLLINSVTRFGSLKMASSYGRNTSRH